MDKLTKYQNILRDFLGLFADRRIYNMPKVQSQCIISEDKKHYMVVDIGWHRDSFIHDWVFHFEIKNEQIWVHANATDVNLEKELTSRGAAIQDIFGSFLEDYEEIEGEMELLKAA